jgi:hypothetical protein
LLVHALEVLLEAAKRGIALLHGLVQPGKLVQNDVLMIAACHCPPVALGSSIVALKVVVFITVTNGHLHVERFPVSSSAAIMLGVLDRRQAARGAWGQVEKEWAASRTQDAKAQTRTRCHIL